MVLVDEMECTVHPYMDVFCVLKIYNSPDRRANMTFTLDLPLPEFVLLVMMKQSLTRI